MSSNTNFQIAALVDDLHPVRAMRVRNGIALAGVAAVAVILSTVLLLGLRTDVAAGRFQPLFLFANGLFLIVAMGTALAAIRMGMPRVGQSSQGWKSVMTAAALLPVAALIMLVSQTELMPSALVTSHELKCVAMGLALGLLNAAVLVGWLRRGAPTSPERAGLLVGLSSGALGIFAFAFHCPFDSFYHVGLWHMMPLVLGAILGRLVVPPLVRW